jgi:hypothetical protein
MPKKPEKKLTGIPQIPYPHRSALVSEPSDSCISRLAPLVLLLTPQPVDVFLSNVGQQLES